MYSKFKPLKKNRRKAFFHAIFTHLPSYTIDSGRPVSPFREVLTCVPKFCSLQQEFHTFNPCPISWFLSDSLFPPPLFLSFINLRLIFPKYYFFLLLGKLIFALHSYAPASHCGGFLHFILVSDGKKRIYQWKSHRKARL